MTEGASQRPGGPGRRRASLLHVELPCATLDEVRARHPELRSRRFHLRTDQPSISNPAAKRKRKYQIENSRSAKSYEGNCNQNSWE